MLAVVARDLGDLKDQVVFVGGATVDLYITSPGVEPLRVTDDVDCVIEIASRVAYRALEEKLVARGFKHPLDDPQAPICRWKLGDLKVDVMPTDPAILGFSNRWYPDGMAQAWKTSLPDGQKVAAFTLPYFIASKIEAFLNRGKGDFYGSPDIEDIVSVIDGATDFAEKILNAPVPVKVYLKEELQKLLDNDLFIQSILGHLGPKAGSRRPERAQQVLRDLVAQL